MRTIRLLPSNLRLIGWCFALLCVALFIGCGGGGGGGGGSGGGGSSSPAASPPPPTYSYSTYNQIALSGNNFDDYDVAVVHLRKDPGIFGCYSIGNKLSDFKLRYDSEGNAITTIQYAAYDCLDFSISDTPLNFTRDWDGLYGGVDPVDFAGVLNGLLAWVDWSIGIRDAGTLTETVFHLIEVAPYCDIQSNWMVTQYVCLGVEEINYADSCHYDEGKCGWVTGDTTYDTDLLSGVVGDFTFSGDMPTTGTSGFRVKALAKYYADTYYAPCYSRDYSYHDECKPITQGALTVDQFLTANFTAGTLTGSLDLDYDLYFVQNYAAPRMSEDRTIGTLTFSDVQISGNSFTGEIISSDFRGHIDGHFFGPDGKEIGGVIKFMDVEESKFTAAYGVIAFAGAMN
jgi:hypothetical protein